MKKTTKLTPKPKGTALEKAKTGLPAKEQPPAKVVIQGGTLSKLVLLGDLSGLSEQETMEYYLRLCENLGLDPVTRPFDLLVLKGKKVLYAHKGCTDQLRMKYGVSVTDLRGETLQDCYRVTALGRDHKGRTDAATGVVKVQGLKGDDYANAVMKAETKAKRRLTLSLCGLGMLDESEIETIPGATTVNLSSGELREPTVGPDPVNPVYDIDPPKANALPPDPKDSALCDLRDVYAKLKSSGLFTADELREKREAAAKIKDDLQSMIDTQAAWIDDMNARKRAEG